MTVLVYFERLGVALSDVLLSIELPGGGIAVPSIGDPGLLAVELPRRPTGLVRKFFRVHRPGSAGTFLASGTYSHICSVLKNLDAIIANPNVVPNDLRGRFHGDRVASLIDTASKMSEADGYGDFSILGIADGVRIARSSPNQRLEERLPYWGEVIAMGSGAPMLIEWLRQKGELLVRHGRGDEDGRIKKIRAIHNTPVMLLHEDISTQSTLREGVGGYYETFNVCGEVLTATVNALTVFGKFARKNRVKVFEVHRIFFHLYDRDDLIVGVLDCASAALTPGEDMRFPLEFLKVYSIPPMGITAPNHTWTPSRLVMRMLNPQRLTLSIYLGQPSHGIKRFYEGENGRRMLRLRLSGKHIVLRLDNDEFGHFLNRTEQDIGKSPPNLVSHLDRC